MRLNLLFGAFFAVVPYAYGRVVTTTITGTASGFDTSGVFGPANTGLTGKPFTLVLKFDDTQGQVCCASTDATGTSSISYTQTQNPGTATLSIGTGQHVFGTTGRPTSGPQYYGATSYAATHQGQSLNYSITDTGSGQDSLTGYVYPASGSTFPITSWEDYFSSTALGPPPAGQALSFSISLTNPSLQAYGTLTPTSISQPAALLNPQPPIFAAMAILPSGASANGASLMAAVGDFDGDGHQDIATTNIIDSSMSLLYGKGDGTFQQAATFPTGRGPYGIATASSAGRLGNPYGTLYVANGLDNTFSILRFDGAALNQTTTYTVGSEPFGISTDYSVNGGDIGAVANTASNSISVWPSGQGALPASYPAGNTPFGTTFADFNHDSFPDIAVWNYADNTIGIYPYNGLPAPNGAYLAAVTYSSGDTPYSAAAGYFNNDGSPDLAVVNLGANTVSVLLNDNAGKLLPPVAYAVGSLPTAVIALDLNGDSYTDLAVANLGDGTISVLLGKGDGTFLPQVTYAAGTQPYSLQAGDFNGDGRPDLVVSNFFSPSVGLLLQTASGTAARMKASPPGSRHLAPQ